MEAALLPVIRENKESKHHKEPKFISLSLSNLYCTPCSQRHWRQNCIIRRRLVFCNELIESNGSHPTATPCSCHLIFAAWHRAELSPKALPRDLQTVAPWCPAALLLQVTARLAGNAARNTHPLLRYCGSRPGVLMQSASDRGQGQYLGLRSAADGISWTRRKLGKASAPHLPHSTAFFMDQLRVSKAAGCTKGTRLCKTRSFQVLFKEKGSRTCYKVKLIMYPLQATSGIQHIAECPVLYLRATTNSK